MSPAKRMSKLIRTISPKESRKITFRYLQAIRRLIKCKPTTSYGSPQPKLKCSYSYEKDEERNSLYLI